MANQMKKNMGIGHVLYRWKLSDISIKNCHKVTRETFLDKYPRSETIPGTTSMMVKICRQPKLANNSFGWSIVIWNMTVSDSSTTASWMTLSATNKIHFGSLLPTYHLFIFQLQDNFPSSAQSSPQEIPTLQWTVGGWLCGSWCFRTTNHHQPSAVVRLPTQTLHY